MLPHGTIEVRVRLRYPISEAFLCHCQARGLTPSEVLRSLAAQYVNGDRTRPAPLGLKKFPGPKEPPGNPYQPRH